jgi:dihydrolipoamide dehydrogenase
MNNSFDVVVIGGGPGGYIAAIRAAQLGLKTACVDEWRRSDGKPALGGTCTNVGCIPSKALLQSSENYDHAMHAFGEHGIRVNGVELDLAQMLKRKNKVVRQNNEGIVYLFKKNKVVFFHGRGSFDGGGGGGGWRIKVSGNASETLTAKHVVLATGSKPRPLPGTPFDNAHVLDNAGALALTDVPKRLGVVGAGVIGLEMGSVWRRLGAEVTLLEMLDTFLPAADETVAEAAWNLFTKEQGLHIVLGAKIGRVATGRKGVIVDYESPGGADKLECDRLIVSIGRIPNTDGLEAAAAGLKLDSRGFIEVGADCRTNLSNVWAIGDVVRGPMLAHKAEEEGVAVAQRIAGGDGHVDFNTVPWVVYTTPEIAWVGRTEQQLKNDGVAYRAGSFPFMANGRARAMGDTRGFVKFLADAATDRILGVHIIGALASEMISEAVVAMEFHATAEDIALICHAHPSLSEAMKEAALAVDKRTLNL